MAALNVYLGSGFVLVTFEPLKQRIYVWR